MKKSQYSQLYQRRTMTCINESAFLFISNIETLFTSNESKSVLEFKKEIDLISLLISEENILIKW